MSGGGTGRRVSGSAPRLTYFKWKEVRIGPIQALTPREGEADSGPITPEQHIKTCLGFDAAALANDDRPTLVYFHWPHEHKVHGKLTTTICTHVMNDEHAARWSKLFRCVQVDMGESEEKYVEMIGVKRGPSLVVLDDDLKVVAHIPATKSGSKLRKGLEKAFNKLPAYKKSVQKELKRQAKMLAEAKKLEKKGRTEDALAIVDKIRFGDLRIGPEFEKAYAYGMKLALKVEREMERGG